jgi:hypothetical protein
MHWDIILGFGVMGVEFHLLHSRMMTFENRVFRRIFRHERDDEMGDWINLHKEERKLSLFLTKYW